MSRFDDLVKMNDQELSDLIRKRGRETGTSGHVEIWFKSTHPGGLSPHLDMVAFILEQEQEND